MSNFEQKIQCMHAKQGSMILMPEDKNKNKQTNQISKQNPQNS